MKRVTVCLAALLSAVPLAAQVDAPASEPTAVFSYGDEPLQQGALRIPDGAGPFPVVVTIHGGCWLDSLGEGTLAPVASALADEGIATWDIEYRRLGHEGGGWPGTFQDVGAGVDHLRVLAKEYPLDLDRVVLIGHSSGAQLAVWAAGRSSLPATSEIRGASPLEVRGAVAMDGPMNLEIWHEQGLDSTVCGRPVISELLGGTPETQQDRYAEASPALMPPIDASIYLTPAGMMIGLGDPDVMTRRAATSGENVTVVRIPDSNHFQLITPGQDAWLPVLQTVRTAVGLESRD